ncbi:uncharacterized protein [Drosophila takahashii]|uniref:uncharacterized protein n=1 Tax=Drosophila takahashii TaxID=29030 RepID=UPI0038993257
MGKKSRKKTYKDYYLKQRVIEYKKKKLALKERINTLKFEKELLKIEEQRRVRSLSFSSSSSLSSSSSSWSSNNTSTSRSASPDPIPVHHQNEDPARLSLNSSPIPDIDQYPETSPSEVNESKYCDKLIAFMELAVQIKNNEWKLKPLVPKQCRFCRKKHKTWSGLSNHRCDWESCDLGCYCGFLANSAKSFYGHMTSCTLKAKNMERNIKRKKSTSPEKVSSPTGSNVNLDASYKMDTESGEELDFEAVMLNDMIIEDEESVNIDHDSSGFLVDIEPNSPSKYECDFEDNDE